MSEELKRYDMNERCHGESGMCLAEMVVRADGDYVLYADHIAAMNRAPAAAPDSREAFEVAYSEYAAKRITGNSSLIKQIFERGWQAAMANKPSDAPETWLSYVDCECIHQQDKALHTVSGLRAGQAFNDLCKMVGGRWPDAKIENEAPVAFKFFMEFCGAKMPEPIQSAAQIRDAALEEAAQICTIPGSVNWVWQEAMEQCASNIRALKSKGERHG